MIAEDVVAHDEFIDFANTVHGGGVVFAAESAGDLWEGEGEVGFHNIHGDLAREKNVLLATFTDDFTGGEMEVGGGGLNDGFGAGARASRDSVLEFVFELVEREAGAETHLEESGVVKGAFQFANVGGVFLGDEFDDFGREIELVGFYLAVENGAASLKIGWADIDNHALTTARFEPVGEVGDARWRTIGADDDLLVVLLERIKGVEEFFLAFLLALEELHIVDDEHVVLAVFFGEAGEFLLDAGDKIFIKSVD